MQYREFGNTKVKISALGLGTMRLPMITKDDKKIIDEENAIAIVRKAYDKGVNYFDTAYFYLDGLSEGLLGRALKGIRDKVYVSTKFPYWGKTEKSDYRRILEDQLKKLDTDYIDFYHFHGISKTGYEDTILKNGYIEEAVKAKNEGLIRHISFSFHDKPEVLKEMVDTGYFETLLCQYNFLDRSNEEAMAYAKSKGLGIVVMGPVAGGRIAGMTIDVTQKSGIDAKSNSELALRFVLANPNVDCALSGMGSVQMVEENAVVAARADEALSQKEKVALEKLLADMKRLSELYCTGCDYCKPCPHGVNISYIFSMMNNYRVYGLKDYAINNYNRIGMENGPEGEKADKCVECGICETKCPQKIEIIKQLKECREVFG